MSEENVSNEEAVNNDEAVEENSTTAENGITEETVREALRRKGSPYDELGLDDPKWTDDELIELMLKHPILINRPFVVTDKGTRLARPKETVLEIL